MRKVAIVRYEKPLESVKKAVELSRGFRDLTPDAKVFIKPNIVFWSCSAPFPKWGVITTSRVVEDVVMLLWERGVDDITIGEGMTLLPGNKDTPARAFSALGYELLKERLGVKTINVHERPFERVDLGGFSLNFNTDILHSDLIVNLPVLKTHAQTVVSLGIKNLKGTIDIESRKFCHTPQEGENLHSRIAKLPDKLPPIFTLIDGIFSLELGPSFDGRARRSDLLIASSDILAADMVGAMVLGYRPQEVPHLVFAARDRGRPLDLADITIVGERLDKVSSPHRYKFPYNEDETLPIAFVKRGIDGLSYRKYDETMCTYCSQLNGAILLAIADAWKGKTWGDVEVLTGKSMKPTPGKKKTILLGKCMYEANKDDPNIEEMIAVRGCPPSPKAVVQAFHRAGIGIDPNFFENMDAVPRLFSWRYEGREEFEESFFTIK